MKKPLFGKNLTCEIQVRTMIEDAWGEIDHIVRYPNNLDNEIFNKYLLLFNALAGSADEMGSFLVFLKNTLLKEKSANQEAIESLNGTISELKEELSNLQNINETQKDKINSLVAKLDSKTDLWDSMAFPKVEKSPFEWLSYIQNPSGITSSNQIFDLQKSLQKSLSGITPKDYTGLFSGFEMPKIGTTITPLEDFIKSTKKK